jgi:hypothetical protein
VQVSDDLLCGVTLPRHTIPLVVSQILTLEMGTFQGGRSWRSGSGAHRLIWHADDQLECPLFFIRNSVEQVHNPLLIQLCICHPNRYENMLDISHACGVLLMDQFGSAGQQSFGPLQVVRIVDIHPETPVDPKSARQTAASAQHSRNARLAPFSAAFVHGFE